MVDNRAAGFYGIAGAFNFKSGDISGTAAKTSDDRASQGTEYGRIYNEEEQFIATNRYVDNSAQINATLNSLAMMNVASVINSKLPKINPAKDIKKILEEAEKQIEAIDADEGRNSSKKKSEDDRSKEDDEETEYF